MLKLWNLIELKSCSPFPVKQRDHFCKNICFLFIFSPLVHIFAEIRAKICARQEQMHAEDWKICCLDDFWENFRENKTERHLHFHENGKMHFCFNPILLPLWRYFQCVIRFGNRLRFVIFYESPRLISLSGRFSHKSLFSTKVLKMYQAYLFFSLVFFKSVL